MTKQQEFRKQTEEAKFEAFSLMCKKVAELEKDNAELKEKNKELGDRLCNVANNLLDNWCKGDDPCPHLAKLEQENAELKKNLSDAETAFDKMFWQKNELIQNEKDNLTKAKDLLAKWVELFKPKLDGYPITPIQEQTEQFLNSEVEK